MFTDKSTKKVLHSHDSNLIPCPEHLGPLPLLSLVLYPGASPFLNATERKRRMLGSFDPTSPSTIANIKVIAAAIGSLTIERFSRASVAVWLKTPGRTRDTDKKKQRGDFHIHVCKAGYP